MRRSPFVLAIALLASLAIVAAPRAAEPPCEFEGIDRIVAVGDVHGAYDRLLEILRTAAIIDRRDRWAGGRAHLVQLGDVVDRGPDSRKVIDLYRRLEREAASAGGRVHFLLGNHEAMQLLGDFRYVVPGEYAAFVTSSSEALRQQVLESVDRDLRDRLLKDTPLGMIERIQAFAPKAPYGSFLRTLNTVVRINGILFLHGGISPAISSLRCSAINATIRRELSEDLEQTRAAPQTSLATREDGPMWYRGLALEPDAFGPQVDEILAAQDARALVVAHTVQSSGRILARFNGKVLLIDTGMQPAYVPTGRASALEIRGGVFTAIYRDGREIVVDGRRATVPPPLSEAR